MSDNLYQWAATAFCAFAILIFFAFCSPVTQYTLPIMGFSMLGVLVSALMLIFQPNFNHYQEDDILDSDCTERHFFKVSDLSDEGKAFAAYLKNNNLK